MNDELKGRKNREKYIPHSTLITRLKELVDSNLILETDSGILSKKKLSIMKYNITLYGFIRLLQLCEEDKFYLDIFQNSKIHSPSVIWNQIQMLIQSKMLDKKQLFAILVDIAKNIDIQIDYNPRRSSGTTISRPFFMSSSLYFKEIKWVHVFNVLMKIRQINNDYNIERTFIASGKTEKEIRLQDGIQFIEINRMFIFAFVNELIMRCYRTDGKYAKYLTLDEAPFLLETLRFNKILKRIYFETVDDILYQQGIERDTILNVQKSLRSKRSLISRKKLK